MQTENRSNSKSSNLERSLNSLAVSFLQGVALMLMAVALMVLASKDATASSDSNRAAIDKASATAHIYEFQAAPGATELSGCSGTAISDRAFLTAKHCAPKGVIKLNGQTMAARDILLDAGDSAILVFDPGTFKNWARFAKAGLKIGDQVFFIGNPGDFQRLYRSGSYAGRDNLAQNRAVASGLFDLNIFPGDSGAGVFNEAGELTCVISGVKAMQSGGIYFKIGVAFSPGFTTEQLRAVGVK